MYFFAHDPLKTILGLAVAQILIGLRGRMLTRARRAGLLAGATVGGVFSSR